ncbi:MAG TPA: GNAT family N-acetyltransferase [Roseomonas sp.]
MGGIKVAFLGTVHKSEGCDPMIVLHDQWAAQASWDSFVEGHEEARFSHLWNYGAVAECYGYKRQNICFAEGEKIVAVLPTVQAKSILFGRRLISQPFSEYGGLLLSTTLNETKVGEIFGLLKAFLGSNGAYGTLEIHGNHGVRAELRDATFLATHTHRVAYLDVRKSEDDLWRNVLNHSARKSVSKAIKSGIVATEECTEELIRDDFFPLYLKSMKRLGSPPHKLDYYIRCHKMFGDNMRILWANVDGKRVAALLGFSCGKRINIINTVSDPEYWSLCPNDLLHWMFICKAAAEGYSFFDFGSVRYQGQDVFKKKWGCHMEDHKQYFLSGSDAPTAAKTFDSSGGLMSTASKLWARYVPDAVSTHFGPAIRQQLMR